VKENRSWTRNICEEERNRSRQKEKKAINHWYERSCCHL